MTLAAGSSILNFTMYVAAFAVVVLVVMFAHPAARTSRVVTLANAPISSEAAAASFEPASALLSRHGASE